ncbi:MAG TPA: class I SAM-dependent methyltransferase, partial [Polyangiales bacterium]|nr:class I SAM-dependent methyltransferase [Polyangiales bacterium]
MAHSSNLPNTALLPPERVKAYDMGAWFYDAVVGSRLYHHVVWGMSPMEHTRFCERALAAPIEGPILDAGCGSLLFTAPCYGAGVRELTLLDASAGMLARARQRLDSAEAKFVQGDLRALPFANASFRKLFHFGVLHCIDESERVLSELSRVARPGAQLFLSCLTLSERKLSNSFLQRLHRAGHVASPLPARTVLSQIERAGFTLLKT